MKINWKVRFTNPVFWVELIVAILLPILTHMGMNWQDITTWAMLGNLLWDAVQSPVIVVAVAVSIWNAITDPTTAGIGDSVQALTYSKPKKDE
jgi:phi LC3 family holin